MWALLACLLFTSFVLALGCSRSEPTKVDPQGADRTLLAPVLREDERASHAMGEVDAAAQKGDLIGALDAVDKRARPAIEEGLRIAREAQPRTDWGRSRRDALSQLLADRKSELVPYSEALRSGDSEKLLAVLEAQAKIERRAVAVAAELNANGN